MIFQNIYNIIWRQKKLEEETQKEKEIDVLELAKHRQQKQKEEEEDPQHSRKCNIWSELQESIHAHPAQYFNVK